MITIQGYTDEDIKFLINNYQAKTNKQLAKELNKTYGSIQNAARKLNLIKQPHKAWSSEEDEYLIKHYIDMTSEELAKKLNRTISSINARRDALGLIRNATWSDDEVAFLIKNYINMEHSEIAQKLNRTESAVRAKCFDLNLYKKEKPWEEWEIVYIRDHYCEMSKNAIAEKLNRTPSAIGLKASRMGLKKYPYYCNYHYFDIIDTEEKAYWLGFMTADGWISQNKKTGAGAIGIELQYSDIGHLRKFNKSIQGNYKITDRWRSCEISSRDKETLHHTCVIRVYSRKMYDSLCACGLSQDKSYIVKFPDIEPHLVRHYIRGYFDGDGCFSVSNNHLNVKFVTVSYNYFQDLSNYLNSLGLQLRCFNELNEFGTMVYYTEIRYNKDKLLFLDYIYKDSNIYLDRKHKKYLKAKSIYSTRVGLAS